MIYEYAISPDQFKDPEQVRYWKHTLGPDKGRLLSDIPKGKWCREAYLEINRSRHQPVLRKSLKVHTRRIFESAKYFRNECEPEGFNWLDTALKEHSRKPFKAIIVGSKSTIHNYVLENNINLEDHELWRQEGSYKIERSAEKMTVLILPMLVCAKEIHLVDRNFRPQEARFRNFLLQLTQKIGNYSYNSSVPKIFYHLGDKNISLNELNRQCSRHIIGNLPSTVTVSFCLRAWNDLHDRYVLTDIGGVKFGVGLDECLGEGVTEVQVDRLSIEEYVAEWKKAKSARVSLELPETLRGTAQLA
jgi:hypothetical protein